MKSNTQATNKPADVSTTDKPADIKAFTKQLNDLQIKIDAANTQIEGWRNEQEEIRQKMKEPSIFLIAEIMQSSGISAEDLGFTQVKPDNSTKFTKPAIIKYRDGENTWTGKGREPLWLTEALRDNPSKTKADYLTEEGKIMEEKKKEVEAKKASKKAAAAKTASAPATNTASNPSGKK